MKPEAPRTVPNAEYARRMRRILEEQAARPRLVPGHPLFPADEPAVDRSRGGRFVPGADVH